ncbi:hypothetical protein AAVH_28708 [Aphelenchoides avenae]|nr:hypothetical protein AAVH_28708 [Aphelenchus avenae]
MLICFAHLFYQLTFDLRRSIGDSLQKSYQLNENSLTTKVVFPCSLIHTVIFVIYLAIAGTVRLKMEGVAPWLSAVVVESTHMTLSVYMCVTLTFFHWVSKRSVSRIAPVKQHVNETDTHFDMFNKQMDAFYSQTLLKKPLS